MDCWNLDGLLGSGWIAGIWVKANVQVGAVSQLQSSNGACLKDIKELFIR
jgi:hypothetical protein